MNLRKISVLMPAYNSEEFIAEAIKSILVQSFTEFELLISDDASTDGTLRIIEEYADRDPRIRVFKQDKNLGFVRNRNFLMEKAEGEFLAWQDSDDVSYPERLRRQLDALKSQNVKMVVCDLNRIRKVAGSWRTIEQVPAQMSHFIFDAGNGYSFMPATMLFSQDILQQAGKFNSYFEGVPGEDFYWILKINSLFPIYFLGEVLYGYRVNETSVTNHFKERSLVMPAVLKALAAQHLETRSDWLEEKNFEKLAKLEDQLLKDPKFMSEQFRIWAAKAIDSGNYGEALRLLKRSYRLNSINRNLARTGIYFIKRKFLRSKHD